MGRFAGKAEGGGNSEIREYGVAILEEDVLGFYVAVYDPLFVRVSERGRYLAGDCDGIPNR